jgi:hypothetical protein
MNYDNPAGSSPHGSDHVVNGVDLSEVNHANIPIVDWNIYKDLKAGYHKLSLNSYRSASLYKWAGIGASNDPAFVRAAARDLGKSGSDGSDNYGSNPKYGGTDSNYLCSEFVSWYYYHYGIKVNGKSLRDITTTQQLHDLFKAEGTLYRYNSGNYLQDFVHATTGETYIPQAGDFLERRGPDGAEHAMIMLRWLPKDPSSLNSNDRLNQALVINGPAPVTLRLVKIHKDETATGENYPKDYYLGRIK